MQHSESNVKDPPSTGPQGPLWGLTAFVIALTVLILVIVLAL